MLQDNGSAEIDVGRGAVVYDTRSPDSRPCCQSLGRCLHHVTGVHEDRETGEVYVHIWDGTHTTDDFIHADDFWRMFDPAGWQYPVDRKPTYHLTRDVGVYDHHDLMVSEA